MNIPTFLHHPEALTPPPPDNSFHPIDNSTPILQDAPIMRTSILELKKQYNIGHKT